MIDSLLITTDNFWIGGRETFLECHLGELKRRKGTRLSLLASSVRGLPAKHVFDDVVEVGVNGGAGLKEWISQGAGLISRTVPKLLWAQHYQLLPALLLSQTRRIPLIVTFHGPVHGVGRPHSAVEAVGMAFALHRAPLLTAISEEVGASLQFLGARRERIRLLPNRVRFSPREETRVQRPVRIVLLTREQKLGHIRAALHFLRSFRELCGPAELVIHSGTVADKNMNNGNRTLWRDLSEAARRLGRRWLIQNPQCVVILPFVRFEPATTEPQVAIAQSDIVLGMGRVTLEGLAAGKPTVLIGYEQIIDLVKPTNFDTLRKANFSGRLAQPNGLVQIIRETQTALTKSMAWPTELLADIDVAKSWPKIYSVLCEALSDSATSGNALPCSLYHMLVASSGETAFLKVAYEFMSPPERFTFEQLINARSFNVLPLDACPGAAARR